MLQLTMLQLDPALSTALHHVPPAPPAGSVLSAVSDGAFKGTMDLCDVVTAEGTSMAAPGVAGAAALVRQYFREGYYPTGVLCTCHHLSHGRGRVSSGCAVALLALV